MKKFTTIDFKNRIKLKHCARNQTSSNATPDLMAVRDLPSNESVRKFRTLVLLHLSSIVETIDCAPVCRGQRFLKSFSLDRIRSELAERYADAYFSCILDPYDYNLLKLEDSIRQSGWAIDLCLRAATKSCHHKIDTVQLVERINAARILLGYSTITRAVVITHDNLITEPLQNLLQSGGHATIVGSLEAVPMSLRGMSEHPRCEYLDLVYDLDVIRQPKL